MKKKFSSLCLSVMLLASSIPVVVNAEETTTGNTVGSSQENPVSTPNDTVLNMNDLPVDLVEDVEVEEYEESAKEIKTEEEDFTASISKEDGTISFENNEGNEISVSVDDLNLEYIQNDEGTVLYTNESEGYSVESQILDGGFRQMFTMDSPQSPKEFKIDLQLKEGHRLVEEEGLYFVKDEEGNNVYKIGAPWAVDSLGNFIETSYEVVGDSIYQKVNYEGENYPLKADPLFCDDTIDNTSTKWDSSYAGGKGTFSIYTRTCAKVYITAHWAIGGSSPLLAAFAQSAIVKDMWAEITADADYSKHISSSTSGRIKDQFICHAWNPSTVWKSSWNLEPWRPDKSLWNTYLAACNPT